jgi:AraC family transcriptional regulator, transcriptional activator of pobA
MDKTISPFNWRAKLAEGEVSLIGDDVALLDNPIITPDTNHPFKLDVTVVIICSRGTIGGSINLKQYIIQSPCLAVILPDQILQYESASKDFSGQFIVMSKRFTDNLFMNVKERFPLFMSVYVNPCVPLNEDELKAMGGYFTMLQRTVSNKDNPHRIEVVKHLILAFFYGTGYQYHKIPDDDKRSKQDILADKFLHLLRSDYKNNRSIEFYADKLCLTPKYLSKVVKESSGKSASEWINDFVIMEAKALIKSTNMTIQQISDELNFPSQSFFGKYFKRHVDMSPKEYKKR